MKCFGIWINDDGSAQVAELTPEQGQTLIDQVDAQPAASADEAMQMLREMIPGEGENEGAIGQQSGEEAVMRGYNKGAKPMMAEKMAPKRVFGE